MIEINLLPAAIHRSAQRRAALASFRVPGLAARARTDAFVLFAAATWLVIPLVVARLYFGARSAEANLNRSIERAVTDSGRHASIIEANRLLQERGDTMAEKLRIIAEVDGKRFVWPRLLADISAALPDHTWLTGIAQIEGALSPRLRIEGLTGSNAALTRFMNRLEAAPSLQRVRLASTEAALQDERTVHAFAIEARYAEPPPDHIQTLPLFTPDDERQPDPL